ncbi:M23 family metallopeptidase [Iodobacter ciconiae]|uniref:M23 family metallopeptidase n=1 Tax=Iodobacter ciconiae TaxID=2496266 RepID=A0A3S8ZTN4_9NEIS|nr:M23 family metallopeptidase [Iodobacter ciconiae]AZN36838.1 M23 family metallopeptidase [Iodobacter ciconiae]
MSIHILDMTFQAIKKPLLKLEYDGAIKEIQGDEMGWVYNISIIDLSKGLKVYFKKIDGNYVLISDHKTLPIGKKTLTLTSRSVKIKDQFYPKEGKQQQTNKEVLEEIKKKNSPPKALPPIGEKTKLPRTVPEKTPAPILKTTRLEGGAAVQVVAVLFTEGNLLLPKENEKYRPILLAVAKKYKIPPQALAAKIDCEAEKSKSGEWKNDSKSDSSSTLGLAQFLKGTWLSLSKNPKSLMAIKIKSKTFSPRDSEVLGWRADAEMSIDTAALYIEMNLESFKGKGVNIDSLSEEDKIKVAYLAHHDGSYGARLLINDEVEEEDAKSKLEKQLGKEGETLAKKFSSKFNGSYKNAYRYWVFHDLIDARLRPDHFMVDPRGYKVKSMGDIAQSLGGPALRLPTNQTQPSVAKPKLPVPQQPKQDIGRGGGGMPSILPNESNIPNSKVANSINWKDPITVCTIRTAGLASKKSAMFGMVRNGGKRAHQGLDLAAEPGTLVFAVADSKVVGVVDTDATPGKNYGRVVVIEVDVNDLSESNKLYYWKHYPEKKYIYFFYAHLDSIAFKSNTTKFLSAGDLIGTVGSSGNARGMTSISKGAHLHFEARSQKNTPRGLIFRLDPLPFINNCTNR